MKKIFYLLVIVMSMLASNVYASNIVNYTLNITDDFKFKETIKYSISNTNKITNGYNYFYDIINDKTYTDIFFKTPYTKAKAKQGSKYLVTLSHTYSEYTFSNSNFLNNCFESSNYEYDIDKYSFTGKNGFNCMNADSLMITLITNMQVNSSNATTTSGNKYIWTPQNEDFTMNLDITKEYKKTYDAPELDDVEHARDPVIDGTDSSTTDQTPDTDQPQDTQEEQNTPEKTSNPASGIIIAAVILGLSVTTIIIVITLKIKKNQINKI